MPENILQTIASATQKRIEAQRAIVPLEAMMERAYEIADTERATSPDRCFAFPFENALRTPGMSFICEVKQASPSKGVIASDFDPVAIGCAYEEAGASAISCLTEPQWFMGSNAHLSAVARAVSIPVLRKDFVVDEYMVYQARVFGASAVLLICSILDDKKLASCVKAAHEIGLSALVEAYEPEEIPRALEAGARIVGVNNRNLQNFEVDFGRSIELRPLVGPDCIFVSESGVKTREDVMRLEESGIDAVLVGETLMRAPDTQAALKQLRGRQ